MQFVFQYNMHFIVVGRVVTAILVPCDSSQSTKIAAHIRWFCFSCCQAYNVLYGVGVRIQIVTNIVRG